MSSICTTAFQSAPKWSSGSNLNCDRDVPAVDETMCFDVARWSESMPKLFALNFRSGLLIGCAIAIAVAAAAFAYDRYDAKTQGRCAGAQLDLDHIARNRLRPAFRGGVVLRRPGFHGAEGAQDRLRPGPEWKQGLRPVGHDHRAEPRRLFPRQQHQI